MKPANTDEFSALKTKDGNLSVFAG